MDPLTARAERALLGAMIEDPALAGRVRISPAEFASRRHAAAYESIRAAARARPFQGTEGWRAAILRAGPFLTAADLDALAAACPFAAHGPAYAVMVVQAWARRHLDDSSRALDARSRQLDADSRQLMPSDPTAAVEMAATAGQMREVAFAIHEHARDLSPASPGHSSGRRDSTTPERARREEAILAALLHPAPERDADILSTLPAEAFTSPHRQEIYSVVKAMHMTGKPVDELTLDWELATQGIPLDARQGWHPVNDDQTYATRLARRHHGYQEPLTTAAELAAEHAQSRSGHPAGSARLRTADGRQQARTPGNTPARPVPGRPALRLVQPPPEAGPAGRGPQQAR